jgi:tRNA wybutosine-synthesizing protein 4
VDVDYPQLIEKKRDRMLKEALLRDALLKTNLRSAALPIHLRSDKYMALACDLRDLNTLESVLRAEFDVSSTSILFVAEVSVTYMPLADANALICWAGKFDDCMLIAYCFHHSLTPRSSILFARTISATGARPSLRSHDAEALQQASNAHICSERLSIFRIAKESVYENRLA